MPEKKRVGIIVDDDFASKHIPPYQKPVFLSFENPSRIQFILDYFNKVNLFDDKRVMRIRPKEVDDSVLKLAHTKYYINSIKRLSSRGGGLIGDEVFVTEDTYSLAKKAVGGAIEAVERVLNKELDQSFALIRPPGHHAIRENGSGLCIFNNIATAILYLRERLNYKKRIAIIDIDDHFGDGVCQYFYEDPSVLYCSIHEFDYIDWDVGDIDELGEDEGEGTNINFPVPTGISDDDFLEFLDIIEPVLKEYGPDLIIVAAGFDMHFDDPIGSCNLTSNAYYIFAQNILRIAEDVCDGKLAFILEGGYSLVALPYCVHSVIKALLQEKYERPDFEYKDFSKKSPTREVAKIKSALKKLLSDYWSI